MFHARFVMLPCIQHFSKLFTAFSVQTFYVNFTMTTHPDLPSHISYIVQKSATMALFRPGALRFWLPGEYAPTMETYQETSRQGSRFVPALERRPTYYNHAWHHVSFPIKGCEIRSGATVPTELLRHYYFNLISATWENPVGALFFLSLLTSHRAYSPELGNFQDQAVLFGFHCRTEQDLSSLTTGTHSA